MIFNKFMTIDEINVILSDISKVTSKDLYELLSKYHGTILKEIYNDTSRFSSLTKSTKFITVLTQAISDKDLDIEEKTYCNDLLYTNMVYNNDDYMRKLVSSLGYIINKDIANRLISLNLLDKEMCIFLSIADKSSFKDYATIRRVNFALAVSSHIELTIKNVIDIYSILYSDKFSSAFITSIMDMTIQNGIEEEEPWVTAEAENNDNTIATAVVFILESTAPSYISFVLRTFYDKWNHSGNPKTKSIKSIIESYDGSFYKTKLIIEELYGDGIIIP